MEINVIKKVPFSSSEREFIVALVRERPIIEDKHTNSKNIDLKKKAWDDLSVAFNAQPYFTQRNSYQLKRCWENIKTLRKKKLSREATSIKRTGVGPPEGKTTDNVIKSICPFINLKVPDVIDSNSMEISEDITKKVKHNEHVENTSDTVIYLNRTTPNEAGEQSKEIPMQHFIKRRKLGKGIFNTPLTPNTKCQRETDARIKRCIINMEQDKALHDLRLEREKILIMREKNVMKFEENEHKLQIEKLQLEIALLKKKLTD